MRFFLLDRISDMVIGKHIEGIKCFTYSEDFFQDHFPGFPVVPGVLLIESCAQLLGILIEESYKEKFGQTEEVYVLLSIVHKAKFRDFITPGSQCKIHGELKSLDSNRSRVSANIFVEEKLVSEMELSFIIVQASRLPENPFANKREEYLRALNMQKMIENNEG